MRVVCVAVVLAMSCSEKSTPAPLAPREAAPAPEPKVEAPQEPEPPELPEPIESVAAFPDELPQLALDDRHLLESLTFDPAATEAALAEMREPDAFRIAILAELAVRRGETRLDADPAPMALPPFEPAAATGVAWVATDDAVLVSGKTRTPLRWGTRVEVTGLQPPRVVVELATRVVFKVRGDESERVTQRLEGSMPLTSLTATEPSFERLMHDARTQPDTDEGRAKSVMWWSRAWQLEHSERTRIGLLEAGFRAKDARAVAQAASARAFVLPREVTVARTCGPHAPPSKRWADAKATVLADDACLPELDMRPACEGEPSKRQAAYRAMTEQPNVSKTRMVRLTVDARAAPQVLLAITPLEKSDPCNEFEEVTLDTTLGHLRRLPIPLGTRSLEVWVPVELAAGNELAFIAASTEAHAVTWLRSRQPYRWTIGKKGELEPSLGVHVKSFDVPRDVEAISRAIHPDRSCDCR